jgi:hypothetical protein
MIKNWNQFNESSKFKHPSDIRVSEEQFLEKESNLLKVDFTQREIDSVNKITDFKNSYLRSYPTKIGIGSGVPLSGLNTIYFETTCGHYYMIITKLEDEWYLILERPKRGYTALSKGFFMADGFEQVEDFLKWYI